MHFGKRLRALREKKGWSQYRLAQESGVAPPVIGRLEAGQRGRDGMSVGVALRLSRALRVSLDHLVGMYDDDSPDEPVVSTGRKKTSIPKPKSVVRFQAD